MSAPRTNVEKQTRRHLFPIVAIIVILIAVGLGFFWWLADETNDPTMPGEETGPVEEMTQPQTSQTPPPAEPAE